MKIYFYGLKNKYIEEIKSSVKIYFDKGIGDILFEKTEHLEQLVSQDKKNHIYFCVPEYVCDDISGIDFARFVRKCNKYADIVFLSSNNLSAVSILKKYICPTGYFLLDEIPEAVSFMSKIISARDDKNKADDLKIEIISQYEKLVIPINNIVYFVTYNKKIMCKLVDDKSIEFYGTLSQIENEYKPYFLRCHAGYLVNKKKILQTNLSKNYIEVLNDESLPISRKYRPDVKSYLELEKEE